MSTLTITNNFTNATTADATQVNTNFSDVKSFVDSHCLHKDAATVLGTYLEAKIPWGLVAAPVRITTSSSTFTTITDIAGLSITFTAVSGRRYRLMLTARTAVTDAPGSVRISIADSGNTRVAAADVHSSSASVGGAPMIVREEITGISGSKTYKVRGEVISGGGNGLVPAGATDPAIFTIEDVGGI